MDLRFCYRLFARTNRFCALSTMNNKPPKVVSSLQTKSYGDSCQSSTSYDRVDQDEHNKDMNESCGCGVNRAGLSLTKLGREQQQSRLRQVSALKHVTAEISPGKNPGDSHANSLTLFDLSSLVDSHCHLQLDPLGSFSQSAIKLALEMGVHRIMVCGTEPGDDWRRITELYQAHPDVVVPNFGLHPWWIKKYYTSPGNRSEPLSIQWDHAGWLPELENLLTQHPSAGVGECGLDKGVAKEVPYDLQEAVLLEHYALAARHHRALTLHCVGCWDRLLALLTTQHKTHLQAVKTAQHTLVALATTSTRKPMSENTSNELVCIGLPASVVLHSCASMPVHLVPGFARLPNTYFSVSMGGRGNTKDSQITDKGLEFIRAVPPDRLLLETDSPDQLPHHLKAPRNTSTTPISETGGTEITKATTHSTSSSPSDSASDAHHSQVYCEPVHEDKWLQYNEPALLRYHCAHLADALGVAPELLAQQTTENAHRAFNTIARV